MKKLTMLIASVGLIATMSGNAEARSKYKGSAPLAPLAKVARTLQRGAMSALKGRTTMGKRMTLTVRPRARAAMKQAGVRKLRIVGFEFELIFKRAGKATYYMRSFVHPGLRVSLMNLSGRTPTNGKLYATGVAPGRFRGLAKPFAEAAKRLLRSAGSQVCRRLPVVNASTAKRLGVTGRLARKLLRGAPRAKRILPVVCSTLATVRKHRMTIRIDDVAFVAQDARRRIVGLIKADIRLRAGKLELRLNGFRKLRP